MPDEPPSDGGVWPGFGPSLHGRSCWAARCTGAAKILLRGHPGDEAFAAAFHDLLRAVPPQPGTLAVVEQGEVLWLGPSAWLLVAPGAAPEALFRGLERGFANCRAAVVDQSSARQRVRVGGPGVEDMLARGCDLDLDPGAFAPDRCASTLLGPFSVLLRRCAAGDAFDLLVWRSYAPSLWRWIAGTIGAADHAVAASPASGEGSPNG